MPRGRAAHRPDAALRRPAHGRHGAAPGQDRRDGDGRGQDPRRDAACLPERAARGSGTHIVTVNDYLARRDAQWMGPIYHALGLTRGRDPARGVVPLRPAHVSPDIRLAGLRPCTRREAYHADITYGTNNEFGFDYLRDNMRFSLEDMVQREHHYAIVDEVDSILIDEARTPLIISGPAEGLDRPLLQDRPDHPEAHARGDHRGGQALRDRGAGAGRLHRGREVARGVADRAGDLALREAPRGRQPLRPLADGGAPPHQPGAQGPRPLQEGRGLRRSRTGRSSSSTSSPAGSCRAGAGRTGCTRRSRPRKASRSSLKIRRLPQSPSRTTSGCTTSWRG